MTATTETTATRWPPSAVVDRVGRFADRDHVADGDRIVHEGRWRTIERIGPHSIGGVETPGILRVVLDDGSTFRAYGDDLVTVRRYTEGS